MDDVPSDYNNLTETIQALDLMLSNPTNKKHIVFAPALGRAIKILEGLRDELEKDLVND